MIISIFIIFIILSLFLIGLGYLTDENAYSIIGFFFLFLLSSTIIYPGNIEYKTGETEIYIYGDNFTDYHWDMYNIGDDPVFNPSDKAVFLFHKNITNVYTNYDTSSSHWLGVWLAIISVCGIAISLVETKSIFRGAK